MARQAANSRVVRIVTLALREAVRLEANVRDGGVLLQGYFFPGAVTLSTEVRRSLRGESTEFEQHWRFLVRIVALHRGEVRSDRFMAVSALYSGSHFVQRELFTLDRVRTVAPKAAYPLVVAGEPPRSFGEVGRGGSLVADGKIETIQFPEVAHPALI